MTKKEFLETLMSKLSDLDENQKLAVETYYDNYLSNAKSKKEAIANLGPLDDLVEQIKHYYRNEPKPKKKRKLELNIWQIGLLLVFSPVILPIILFIFIFALTLVIVLVAIFLGLIIASFALFLTGIILGLLSLGILILHFPTAFISLGIAFILIGLAILLFFPSIYLIQSVGTLIINKIRRN